MKWQILKKALIWGISSGLPAAVFFGILQVLIDKKPLGEAMFGSGTILFAAVITVAEVFVWYLKLSGREKKNPE